MDKRQFLYRPIWEKYLDQIKTTIEHGIGQGFPIPPSKFNKVGNRKTYGFKLEVKNGKVVNNISGSAVARDLANLLVEDPSNKKMLAKKHFFVRMSNSFYCQIYPVKMYKDIKAGLIA